ncbi:class I SAM-dependent methyltransferase [Hanstruepera ponticola]|uniref:class I SAM-dependent methyltransferase n=1 Tax=Hanstruepera ponticola TaxID=2042995 RepID=UPI000CF11A14|nr:methyltransferase domain-containing protein [Hanstruepera ponticola]
MSKKYKKPWPTKAVMEQIYDQHLWGGHDFDFYSGEGSHKPEIIKPYLERVISFLKTHHAALEVCDLGCGDFNIGKQLTPYTKKYIAIDIVEDLIERNKKLYHEVHLEFHCLDISKDKLPAADCIILRQVLQHLSNAEILDITKKLEDYKYVILTEHLPNDDFTPNLDIISGQGIRHKHNSGVNLLKSPFHLKVKNQSVLHEHILPNENGCIKTILYTTY